MNSIELAELLYSRGHKSVLMQKGFDLEKVLLGYNPLPINSNELEKVATNEGYILTDNGWIDSNVYESLKMRGELKWQFEFM